MKSSGLFKLDTRDFLKGLILSVITAVITIVSQTIEAGSLTFDWAMIGKVTLVTVLSYLTKNLFTNNRGELVTKDTPKP